jgi:hypothetical protein
MEEIFENITKTVYVITDGGFKIPYSDFERKADYYDNMRQKTYTGDEYANMCMFKDKSTALYDKRWKSAKAVIDLIASEIGIDQEKSGLYLYALQQKNGEFESPLVNKIREWFDKSGEKVKLKKRISELEEQVKMLQSMLRRER